eukprot:245229-Pelagomonas_calceolata.AAC.1
MSVGCMVPLGALPCCAAKLRGAFQGLGSLPGYRLKQLQSASSHSVGCVVCIERDPTHSPMVAQVTSKRKMLTACLTVHFQWGN